ncbi:MAG: hypothetical protein LBD12_06225 [Clostridiales Family XIII bacterium]|jgi:hypothetical protein|nr:hypothetical protein [Clostridiales Family XIII bacterium]
MIDRRISAVPWLRICDRYPDITRALRQIDKGYRLVDNFRNGHCFEVHNVDNAGPSTFCFAADSLYGEQRGTGLGLVGYCLYTYNPNRGREFLAELDKANKKNRESNERGFREELSSISHDAAKDISLGVERDETHDGYKRTHSIPEVCQ